MKALHLEMMAAIRAACTQFGVVMPLILWSNRMTASAGRASAKKLTFSVPLLRAAPHEFCMEVAVHEAAHFIDFQRRGKSDHGAVWRQIMAELGYPAADRCHTLDRSHLYRYAVICTKCQRTLVRYTRRPAPDLVRSKRSACCYAVLRVRPIT